MARQDHGARLDAVLRQWPGVESAPHRLGGIEFRVDRREIGHFHPSGMLDVLFPVRTRRELVAAGRAEAHRNLPHTGWVTFRVRTEHDLPAAIDLLRMNYERLRGLQSRTNVLPIIGKVSMVGDRDSEEMPS